MVLAFTEEQKREIEARGMMVIQVKLDINKIIKTVKLVFDKIWDVCKNMSKDQIAELLKPDEDCRPQLKRS